MSIQTKEETQMTYIVVNRTNAFADITRNEYASEELAEEAARAALQISTSDVLITARLLNKFKAEVVVTSESAATAPVAE